jgi:hypothetical protein
LLARTAACKVLHAAAGLPDPRQRLAMASLICAESLRRMVVLATQLVTVARQLRQVAQVLGLHTPVTKGASVPLVQRHSVWLADRSHTLSSGQGLAPLQVPLGRTAGKQQGKCCEGVTTLGCCWLDGWMAQHMQRIKQLRFMAASNSECYHSIRAEDCHLCAWQDSLYDMLS